MATLQDLASLMVGQRQQPNFNRGNFYAPVATVSDQVTQALLTDKKKSTSDRILGAIASGLVGGLADQYSQNYQDDQRNNYLGALVNEMSEKPVVDVSGMDSRLLSTAKQNAGLFRLTRATQAEDAIRDAKIKAQAAFELEKQKERGKLAAYEDDTNTSDSSGTGGNTRKFISPVEQEKFDRETKLRNEFTGSKIVTEFEMADQGLRALEQAVLDPSAMSSVEIVRRAIQAIEPGLAVRTDDQTAIENSRSLTSNFKSKLKSALSGEGGLTADDRYNLLNIARRARTQKAKDFNSRLTRYSTIASNSGLTNDIYGFGKGVQMFDYTKDNKLQELREAMGEVQANTNNSNSGGTWDNIMNEAVSKLGSGNSASAKTGGAVPFSEAQIQAEMNRLKGLK